MTNTPSLTKRLTCLTTHFAILFTLCIVAHAEDTPKPTKPDPKGRPVYLAAGKVIVFPDGMETPPKGYQGSIGATPLALIKIDGKLVGEVYATLLKGTPLNEAKGMVTSAERSKVIELQKRTTFKDEGKNVEVVTLKLSVNSNVGSPWILHSLYFPKGEISATFKLAASEKQFEAVLPYFESMLFREGAKPEQKQDPKP